MTPLDLPDGFEALDRTWGGGIPDFGEEVVPLETIDRAGVVHFWQWSDCFVDWEAAIGFRVLPFGASGPCEGCGQQTKRGYKHGEGVTRAETGVLGEGPPTTFRYLCDRCDGDPDYWD